MAGIILSNSLSAAKAVTESRMVNRRWGDSPLLAGRGRRTVVPSFHCSWAAVSVMLYGDASPAAAGGRLLVFSSADAASWRPRFRALVLAWKQVLIPSARHISVAAGLVLLSSRVKESLDALRHQATLFALELVQLVRRRLGGSNVLHRHGVNGAIFSEQIGDSRAALLDRAKVARPSRSGRAAHSAVHLALVGF